MISCHCNECHILICISLNSWTEVTTSYSTYENSGCFTDPGLELVGQIREGAVNSELEGCLVKPLRCHRCRAALGVRCVEAPVEKRANVNRSYLKLTKLTMKSITSGDLMEAQIKQRQVHSLETSSKTTTESTARRQTAPMPNSSQEDQVLREWGSEVRDTETLSSDQVFGVAIAPSANPLAALEEQRRDIDRILASTNMLQEDMMSLRKSVEDLHDRRNQASHYLAADVDILRGNLTKVSSRLSELDALKLEMKMMQRRIKHMDGSRSRGRQSSAVLGSAQVSRRSSPKIDGQVTPRDNAPSNGLQIAAPQTPISALFEGLFSVNGITSRGSHTSVDMPPPQIPHDKPERYSVRRRTSAASNMVTPSTASTPTSLPRITSQTKHASTGPYHEPQESHIYDDELDEDVRPRSSIGSSPKTILQSGKKTAHSRGVQITPTAQQPLPKTQSRKRIPLPPLTPESSFEHGSARSRHNNKRRKTSAFNANTRSTSIWCPDYQDSEPRRGRRDEQAPLTRTNGETHDRPARFQNVEITAKKTPGQRDKDGYLIKADGTRDSRPAGQRDKDGHLMKADGARHPRSVKGMDP